MELDPVVFTVDGAAVTLKAVIARALLGGALDPVLTRLARARAIDAEGAELEAAEIQKAVNAWRSDRGQASADETRAWLEERGLELSDLVAHVTRARHLAAAPDHGFDAGAMFEPETVELLPAELTLAAELEPLIEQVALEAAVDVPRPEDDLGSERRRVMTMLQRYRGKDGLAEAMGVGPEVIDEAVEHVASFAFQRKRILTAELLEQQLERDARNLVRIEIARASFDDESAALETLICLREESKWLEPFGEVVGFETTREIKFVEALHGHPLGPQLGAGRAGDSFGPVREGKSWAVYEVLGRIEPTAADPEVRAKLQARGLKRALRANVDRRIRMRMI